jgi:hypothetical protein
MLSLILLLIPLVFSLIIWFTKGMTSRAAALVGTLVQLVFTGYAYNVFLAEFGVSFLDGWCKYAHGDTHQSFVATDCISRL